jgi:hypothetical protein
MQQSPCNIHSKIRKIKQHAAQIKTAPTRQRAPADDLHDVVALGVVGEVVVRKGERVLQRHGGRVPHLRLRLLLAHALHGGSMNSSSRVSSSRISSHRCAA